MMSGAAPARFCAVPPVCRAALPLVAWWLGDAVASGCGRWSGGYAVYGAGILSWFAASHAADGLVLMQFPIP